MEHFYKFNELTNYPVIITQLHLSLIVTALIGVEFSQVFPQHDEHIAVQTRPAGVAFLPASHSTTTTDNLEYSVCGCSMDSCNKRQRAISDFPALLLSAKADDIVEASSKLDGIIVILGGFRWIHNERYLDVNTFERLVNAPYHRALL